MSLLSICIVNWNTREYLRETLASVESYPADISQEVIVVDNASIDGSSEMIRTEFPSVRIIENSTNVGYAEGNNQALTASSGDYLLLLNPDVRVLPHTLNNSLSVAQELPEFGALGIKQIGPDGKVQSSLRTFPDPMGVFCEVIGLSRLFPHSSELASYRMAWFDYSRTTEVDQPMATFLLTSRSVYEEVGGMDPAFPIFFNDVDWCYRVKAIGKKIYYTNRAEIVHYGGAGTRKANRAKMAKESKSSLLKFYAKHYAGKIPGPIYNAVRIVVSASLFAQDLRSALQGKIRS